MFEVGVIGCGRISKVYQEAFHNMSDQVHVRFCVDKDIDRARQFAAGFSGCECGTSMEDMLKCHLDTVHVLTPHFLHKEHVMFCLEHGMDVLTEKPIAIYESDGEQMIECARRNGLQLGVIFQNRYIPGIVEAKRMLDTGELGQIRGAYSNLNWWRPESYYQCDWKGSWEKEGGGVVIDQAIHSLDLVRYLVGRPVQSVKASMDRRILTNIEVEDVADAAIRFDNGVVYSFFASNYYTENSRIHIEISAEKGTVHLTGDCVEISMRNGDRKTIPMTQGSNARGESYWGSCHQVQLEAFYQALREQKPVPVDPVDALKTLQLVQAIYTSAREKRTVLLAE